MRCQRWASDDGGVSIGMMMHSDFVARSDIIAMH